MTSVVVDGAILSDPQSASRGLGRYVEALLSSLGHVPGTQVSALMTGPGDLPDAVRRVEVQRFRRPPRLEWYEHIARVGFEARRLRPDVFHSPGIDPPVWYRAPWVQTLHDVIPLVFPDDGWGLDLPRWRVRAQLMRSADAVICISAHTAGLAVRHLGIDARRLHVIHHGVTPIFRRSVEPFEPDRPFVLYVGAFGPHKGYAEAFEVIGRVAAAGLPHVLRVVGGSNASARTAIDEIVRAAPRPDRIEVMERVSDEELLRLYHGADALVVTSRYEGFGRPTIEALATGTPVVSFDNSSLGEILGDGGIHVPDGDVERFAAELIDLLRDDLARADLGRRALDRSRSFDWDQCAAEHVAVYDAIAR